MRISKLQKFSRRQGCESMKIMVIFESMNNSWLNRFTEILNSELPGEVAHKDMIPYRPLTSEMMVDAEDYRESSVAILLYQENQEWKSVFIERPSYEGVHSGQIAFPGGKKDLTDTDLVETAIREMHEEIGFYDPNLELLGQLTKVYIPVSKFLVYPHVFLTHEQPIFTPDAYEVKDILPFSLFEILEESRLIQTTVQTGNGVRIKNVPAFQIQEKYVWGATCLIVNELKMCLLKAKSEKF